MSCIDANNPRKPLSDYITQKIQVKNDHVIVAMHTKKGIPKISTLVDAYKEVPRPGEEYTYIYVPSLGDNNEIEFINTNEDKRPTIVLNRQRVNGDKDVCLGHYYHELVKQIKDLKPLQQVSLSLSNTPF